MNVDRKTNINGSERRGLLASLLMIFVHVIAKCISVCYRHWRGWDSMLVLRNPLSLFHVGWYFGAWLSIGHIIR